MRSKGLAQQAKLDSSGTFTMEVPIPPGTYQVYYVPPPPDPPGSLKVGAPANVKSVVPKKYHTLESSELSFEVKAGKNDIPIEFKD